MLPGEVEFIHDAKGQLDEPMQIARGLLTLGVLIVEQRESSLPENELKDNVAAYRVGHGLCVKACKSLRSSLLLAQIGAANDMRIVSRSMFETYVAICFSLRDSLELGLAGVDDTQLTANDRAKLYLAFFPINRYKELQTLLKDPESAKQLANVNESKFAEVAREASEDVGQDWAKRFQNNPRTYSGLSLKSLARQLGPQFVSWYIAFYSEQSRSTHATDINKHLKYSAEESRFVAAWLPSPDEVCDLVLVNSLMLWGCLDELDRRFQFRGDTRSDLELLLIHLNTLSARMKPASRL
ncbi:MAG: DUF5677 domain-containing protein [Planctomycetaceae bacterium]